MRFKYGALKQPNGHLTVRWRARDFVREWQALASSRLEGKRAGMPPLGAKPQGSGQGRELIEQVLPYQFDAQTTFAMEADGVHCAISLPPLNTK